MQGLHFKQKNLTTAEVYSSHQHRLHRVKLFSAAICHITQGSQVIFQDDSRLVATPDELIIIPANTDLEIVNQPARGTFRSDLLLLSADLLSEFKSQYIQEYPPARLTTLCVPKSKGLTFMWGNLLNAVRSDLPANTMP